MGAMQCRICGNTSHNEMYEVKEMYFGYRDTFVYFQCSQCECLQIADFPPDMSKYYPSDYYSFNPADSIEEKNGFYKFVKKIRDQYAVLNNMFGILIYMRYPNETLRSLSRIPIKKDMRILDVGCGSGGVPYALKQVGFSRVRGADPYIPRDIEYGNGLRIEKKTIHQIKGTWDVITMHHSLEHVPDPVETFQSISRLLDRNGYCIIRIPTVSSHAWEHYRARWVALDAPRHFFLHSVKSIKIIAEKAHLVVDNIVYDSIDWQFWGSEQYSKDIPLLSDRSYLVNPSASIFSKKEICCFKKKAKKLNAQNRGDCAAFYLKKRSE